MSDDPDGELVEDCDHGKIVRQRVPAADGAGVLQYVGARAAVQDRHRAEVAIS